MPTPAQYDPVHIAPLSGGLSSARDPKALRNDQTPDCENVDFDRESVAFTGGARKLLNRPAPRAGLRTTVDPGYAGLSIEAGRSVPLRGYIYLPFHEDLDMGGDAATGGEAITSETFHARRMKRTEGEWTMSFRFESNTKLFTPDARGVNAPAVGAEPSGLTAGHLWDESLDECTILYQKGGDRLAPMSFFIGVVNVGTMFETQTGAAPKQRVSNLAICVGWLDAAGWAHYSPLRMRYFLGTGGDVAAAGEYQSLAYRVMVTDLFVEPGHDYHLAFSWKLDSGSPGAGATPTAAWNEDGEMHVTLTESSTGDPTTPLWERTASSTPAGTTGLYVWKGPLDSIEYFKRYGVRWSSKDASFVGLGMRTASHRDLSSIPFGFDAAPLEKGGYQMSDMSAIDPGAFTPPNTLTATHVLAADSFIEVNLQYLFWTGAAVGAHGYNPWMYDDLAWRGIGSESTGFTYQVNALRGYRLVFGAAAAGQNVAGLRVTLDDYFEVGGPLYRFNVLGLTPSFLAWTSETCVVQCLRWHQRETVFSELALWSRMRTRATADGVLGLRRLFDLANGHQVDDEVQPDAGQLVASWPFDDGEGGVCMERINGRHAYLAPTSAAVVRNAAVEGNRQGALFLSGEMEALTLDLSENPIFLREFGRMQATRVGGFAIQFTAVLTEAHYARRNQTSIEAKAEFAPHIAEWTVRNADAGRSAKPLLRFGHRNRYSGAAILTPFARAMGFCLEVGRFNDSIDVEPTVAVAGFSSGVFNFDDSAPWVGQEITIQVGVHPTQSTAPGDAGLFDCYMAASPKEAFAPVDGDPSEVEFAYYSRFSIEAKDVLRSAVCIGGAFDCGNALGYTELNCRMILKEVRIFAAPAPGVLPGADGQALLDRNGKLSGTNALPARPLQFTDLVGELGEGLSSANLGRASADVAPPGRARFYTGDSTRSLKGILDTYLIVSGDTFRKREEQTSPIDFAQFYRIHSVSAAGDELQLGTPYAGETRINGAAASLRVVGYTAFEDETIDRPLTIGGGGSYVPGTSTVDDVQITAPMFANKSPMGVHFAFRIYNPLVRAGGPSILPQWTRGAAIPRRNPIRGAHDLNGKIFMGAGSCLFEVDDRWREDAPRFNGRWSLLFRGKRAGKPTLTLPEQDDVLLVRPLNDVLISDTGQPSSFDVATVAQSRFFEAWVKLADIHGYQTVAWIGSTLDDPVNLPGSAVGTFRNNLALRFNNGRPEIAVPSTATAASSARPEKGLFVATGLLTVPAGEWVHVRWHLERSAGSSWINRPRLWVNGTIVNVFVNASGIGFAGVEWIPTASLVDTYLADTRLAIGAARDSYLDSDDPVAFQEGAISGLNLRPARWSGWMHGLNGQIVAFRTGHALSAELQPLGNFEAKLATTVDDAEAWDAANGISATTDLFLALQEGVGDRPLANDTSGVTLRASLRSHPFILLYAQLGEHGRQFSFAEYGNRLFVTNGGRTIVHDTLLGYTRPNGLLPPTTKPDFTVERKSLWVIDERAVGLGLSNSPIAPSTADDQDKSRHYSTHGNAYLVQRRHDEMRWDRDDAATAGEENDIFAFKCLVKPRDVSGRLPLYSARTSLASGGIAIEIVDGKLRLGWFDTNLKEPVYIETSAPVFVPGQWHYVFVRKRWLQQSLGNWTNSIYKPAVDATQLLEDSIVVRRFPSVDTVGDGTGVPVYESTIDAKADHPGATLHPNNQRNCISFTTLDCSGVAAVLPGVGRVTDTTLRIDITGAAGLTANFAANATGYLLPFHGDMYGMLIQWVDAAGAARTGRITSITSQNAGTLIAIDGGSAGNLTDVQAAVCIGIKLVPSPQYGLSDAADLTLNDIEVFGSTLAANSLNGVGKLSAEFGSFGYVVLREGRTSPGTQTGSGTNPLFFSGDYNITRSFAASKHEIENGTDNFAGHIYAATPPGALDFAVTGLNFTVIQSTQPNTKLEVEQDSPASVNADALRWNYLVEIGVLDGTRRIFVTFFDALQRAESRPSPALIVSPADEDTASPSGDVALVLNELPISPDPGVWRRVYMTLIDQATPFLVAEVRDNSSTSVSIAKSENEIIDQSILDFFVGVPPRCAVLATSQKVLAYGNLPGQPDGVRYSEPFRPAAVPDANFLLFPSGESSEVVGMAELDSKLYVFKRSRSIYSAILSQGTSSTRQVSRGFGLISQQCLRPIDDAIFAADSRGVYVLTAGGAPQWVARNVKDLFQTTMDASRAQWATAAINVFRGQYVIAMAERGVIEQNVRASFEFDHAETGALVADAPSRMRASRYRHPSVTALVSSIERVSKRPIVVAGDEHGFAWHIDREDTALIGSGADQGTGSSGPWIVAEADAVSIQLLRASIPDVNLSAAGPRGVVTRWSSAGVERDATALALLAHPTDASRVVLLVDRLLSAAEIPAVGAVVTFGDGHPRWETKWLDLAQPQNLKRHYVLDLFRAVQLKSGRVRVTFFVDHSMAVAHQFDMDMSQANDKGLPLSVRSQFVKVRIERVSPLAVDSPANEPIDQKAEFTSLTIRTAAQERN